MKIRHAAHEFRIGYLAFAALHVELIEARVILDPTAIERNQSVGIRGEPSGAKCNRSTRSGLDELLLRKLYDGLLLGQWICVEQMTAIGDFKSRNVGYPLRVRMELDIVTTGSDGANNLAQWFRSHLWHRRKQALQHEACLQPVLFKRLQLVIEANCPAVNFPIDVPLDIGGKTVLFPSCYEGKDLRIYCKKDV